MPSSKRKQKVRENFRKEVFTRDNFKCKICGKSFREVPLDAHHITPREDMPNGGYVKENGITLCDNGEEGGCHFRAEAFLKGISNDDVNTWSSEALYKKINSSYELAVKRANEKKS